MAPMSYTDGKPYMASLSSLRVCSNVVSNRQLNSELRAEVAHPFSRSAATDGASGLGR
jgi:hypothetical protein